MFLAFITLALFLGFVLGPIWLISFTLLALFSIQFPIAIFVFGAGCVAIWVFKNYRR